MKRYFWKNDPKSLILAQIFRETSSSISPLIKFTADGPLCASAPEIKDADSSCNNKAITADDPGSRVHNMLDQ